MDKAFEIQKQVRENVSNFQTYLTDLQNWENEMKRKEAALNGVFEQDLPAVRSQAKKEKPNLVKKTAGKRIKSSDYDAWNKFDAERACEEIDMEGVGPASLDSKKSEEKKQEKLREEALHEKERGNSFVKQEKWDEAISCYNRAIELVKDDAIYFANRGLCYLKKDSLHLAESDCTQALRLDPTYVKAYQRRATARERLGSLRAASQDLSEVLKLEPQNSAARRQLDAIRSRMGTKGAKSKSSPATTPTADITPSSATKSSSVPKIQILEETSTKLEPKIQTVDDKWRNGVGENITVIKPVKKPPHLRSKKALKSIPILEIPLNGTISQKSGTRMKIVEIESDELAHGDSNNNNDKDIKGDVVNNFGDNKGPADCEMLEADPIASQKEADQIVPQKEVDVKNMVAPVSSVQFMSEWKYLKGNAAARAEYLSIIEPSKIPAIFENALESQVLSEVLQVLGDNPDKFREKSVVGYLRSLCEVKRFSALAMFLTSADKIVLTKLLNHCKTTENCNENEIMHLKNKYEI